MRIKKQPMLQPFVCDADHDRSTGSITVAVWPFLRVDQGQIARLNNSAQQQVQQSKHGAQRAALSVRSPIPAGSTRFQYKVLRCIIGSQRTSLIHRSWGLLGTYRPPQSLLDLKVQV